MKDNLSYARVCVLFLAAIAILPLVKVAAHLQFGQPVSLVLFSFAGCSLLAGGATVYLWRFLTQAKRDGGAGRLPAPPSLQETK